MNFYILKSFPVTTKTANLKEIENAIGDLKEIENAIGDAMTDPDIPTMAIYSNIDIAKKNEEELFKDINADDNGFYTFLSEPKLRYGSYETLVSALFPYDDYDFESFVKSSEYEDIKRIDIKFGGKNYTLNICVENISSKEPYGKWVLKIKSDDGKINIEKEIEVTKKYNQAKNEYYYDAQLDKSSLNFDFLSEKEKLNEKIKKSINEYRNRELNEYIEIVYETAGYQTYVAFKTNELFPLN